MIIDKTSFLGNFMTVLRSQQKKEVLDNFVGVSD